MNAPGTAIFQAHHSGIAMEPDNAAIPRDHPIGGAEWFAGEKHLRSFQAPACFVIRVNALIPANRILEPFFSRISQGGFDLRAYTRLADTPVERSHEHNCRYLLQQSAVFRLGVWRSGILPLFSDTVLFSDLVLYCELLRDRSRVQRWVSKCFGQVEKNGLSFGDVWQVCAGVIELTLACHRFLDGSRKRRHCLLRTAASLPPAWLLVERRLGKSAQRMNGPAICLNGRGR